MINQALGMVPNASEHGVYVDAMLEACHWFMALLFIVLMTSAAFVTATCT